MGGRRGSCGQGRLRGRPALGPSGVLDPLAALGSNLKLWLRADLGYNAGAKTWTDQIAGRVFTSPGNPSQVTEAQLNGQKVIQFGAGGGDIFASDAKILTVPAPWCAFAVFRLTSTAAPFYALYGTDNKGALLLDTAASQLYARTSTLEYVGTSAGTSQGNAPYLITYGSGLNIARLNGQSLTHAALTGSFQLNGTVANVGYTVNSGQIGEVIIASVADVTSAIAPYILDRYGKTM